MISKLYEMPVSSRHILPYHSIVQGPIGNFVSKILKWIMKTKQGIIHGSKDLALKLYSLKALALVNFDVGIMKRLFFVLRDVIAFYPDVNIQKAH